MNKPGLPSGSNFIRQIVDTDLANGTLIEVLPDCPPPSVPVSLLYPRNRQLSPRVRVFIEYVMRAFGRI